MRGSVWTFFGYGVSQVIRLGSNIILTRLLFPDAFGVMALVNVFLQGLAMFSDLGLAPNIVQNPRGEEPEFLRTAWTIQIVRGAVICAIATALAWPLAVFYKEPRLFVFLPVAALTAIISGFNSTSLFTLTRRLKIGKLTAIDLGCQVLGTCTMIYWAWLWPSVWALVMGAVVGAAGKMALSHTVLRVPRMHLAFHRGAAVELVRFGKWIFLSTILGFIASRLDRLILGKMMTPGELGVYWIAFMLSGAIAEASGAVSGKVLFPVYARLARQAPERLRSRTLRVRAALMAVTLPPTWILIIWGPEIVRFLYDTRYEDAGWMLQILGAGAVLTIVTNPIESVLLAVGDSFRFMLLLAGKSTLCIGAMAVGGYVAGSIGVIVGFSVSSLLNYPILVALIRRYGVWLPWLDFLGFASSGLAVGLGLWLKGYCGHCL